MLVETLGLGLMLLVMDFVGTLIARLRRADRLTLVRNGVGALRHPRQARDLVGEVNRRAAS